MKKLLILAYDFPPYVSVGGLRPHSWFKYLHEFGVYPIVVTRQWENKFGNHLDYIAASSSDKTIIEETEFGTIIRTPYKPNLANKLMLKYGTNKFTLIRKTISAYYEFSQWLFLIGPKSNLYFAAKKYLTENKVDAIIATGDPFVLFKFASELGKKFNTPWIADYRDPWSQNSNIQKSFFLKKWHSYFEHKNVSSSFAITIVSYFFKLKVSTLIKNKEIFILPNGFEPEAIKKAKNINQQSNTLSIAFVGSIYDWHPLRSFFTVLSDFIEKRKEAKILINFYGINLYGATISMGLDEIVRTEFPQLKNHIVTHNKIPNDKLLQELSKQNVMLLFNYYSFMGTKIFDYIGLHRSILFCYSNDPESNQLKKKHYVIEEIEGVSAKLQEDLITETNSGYIVKDSKHLSIILNQLYDEFIANGFIQCNTINSENYSRKHQVKQLAEIIKNISARKN